MTEATDVLIRQAYEPDVWPLQEAKGSPITHTVHAPLLANEGQAMTPLRPTTKRVFPHLSLSPAIVTALVRDATNERGNRQEAGGYPLRGRSPTVLTFDVSAARHGRSGDDTVGEGMHRATYGKAIDGIKHDKGMFLSLSFTTGPLVTPTGPSDTVPTSTSLMDKADG